MNESNVIRVMTFNIQGATYGHEGVNVWANRAALNVGTIQRASPDLIGFQEAIPENLALYEQELGDYERVLGAPYGEEEDSAWNTIFWRRSRFELAASGHFWLSRTPDEFSCDWGVPYPMVVTWVKLREVTNGNTILHFNTHLEDGADGGLQRVESSKLISARASQYQAGEIPAIVTADFNCNPGSDTYNVFMDNGFVDTYRAAGHQDGRNSTFHGFQGEQYNALEWGGDEPFWRVDWILARAGAQQLQTLSCTIVRDAEPPLYPSDHYPVVAELGIVKREA